MRRSLLRLLLAALSMQVVAWTVPPPAFGQGPLLELDFDLYRDTVEPILLAKRAGNARCVVCHSRGGGNSYLEPLTPGRDNYDEEQSQRNFERVRRLVVPGAPTESILLMNPLIEEAGGSHWHAGGKHWESQTDPEWQTLARWVNTTTAALDFDFYRNNVEPVLLAKRPGNARAAWFVIRAAGGTPFSSRCHPAATVTTKSSRSGTSSASSGWSCRARRLRASCW